ncbi:MAG: 30S ribosomal protein S12 methylthiotransferase RimO [Spirochaetaceae bacterium]|nr:30S ribosomal protein S12 methylthiotransferase RimO [Spirochaetaceae bacterium]
MASYYLDPFGCVKNQVDAETMMAFLDGSGWDRREDAGEADIIIVNSCGFIDAAKQESINAVLAYRKIYPQKKILLTGCLAQRYAAELRESLAEADGFFGNADLSRIAETAAAALGEGDGDVARGAALRGNATTNPGDRPLLSLPGSAYIKIAEGCDNRCAFCAIPAIRGPLHSRAIPEILAECRRLLERGVKELCLIGQDLGCYGRDLRRGGSGPDLPALLEALSTLEGRFWVRTLYIHPDNFPLPILDICRRDRRFLPYFDLPFQHGSGHILRAMNRRGNAEAYLGLIRHIRETLPGAVIRATFLVGFPGETGEDFRELLEFQEKAEIDWAGAFSYSREEGTAAWPMKGRVPKKTAEERKRIVEERQAVISERRMEAFVGRKTEVLVEERIDGEEGLYLGRLPCQAPEIDGAAVISSTRELSPGSLLPARIFARAGLDLEAVILGN